tara:strand:+ start:1320 stop:1550 length:231 start_codon:yes stop_codon:yes gene_type:complete
MKEYTWNVMVVEDGYSEIHTEDLTQEDAEKLAEKLNEVFRDYQYYVSRVEYVEKVERHYNENAVDGWEDIYPDRDY